MNPLTSFKVVLLDMNGTFMFGHDRFGADEEFFRFYQTTNGALSSGDVNRIVREAYDYLDSRYPDPNYHENFPSLKTAIKSVTANGIADGEIENIIDTFAHHERGVVAPEYARAILTLSERHVLGAVIDIWAPKKYWLEEFRRSGILRCFGAMSFSSDSGIVKPSPKAFLEVARQLNTATAEIIFVGDSVRRDLGGAIAAGMQCILVDGKTDARAYRSVENMLALVHG